MLFECCTSLRSDGWVWNVCGGGEEEISPSASSHEKQPLTLHFPQILWEESRTLREWQHAGDIITQMQAERAQAQGTIKETIVPLALVSHLETYMEKKWVSAQQPCYLRNSSSLPSSCDSPAWRDKVGFPASYHVWCQASGFTLCVQSKLGTEHDFWGPC